MKPVLFLLGPVPVDSYAVAVVVAFFVGWWVRRREVARLGYDRADPAHVWVGLGGLLGAVVGAKAGMLLFEPLGDWQHTLWRMVDLDFTGKTVIGGIAGGYLGVEGVKKVVGIPWSTGDGFAVAVPLGQAIGRLGCLLHGCCYGVPTEGVLAVEIGGVLRQPVQIYEGLLCVGLAAWLFAIRKAERPQGHLFRRYLVGYAAIRFALDPLRGDGALWLGPLTAVQWFCAAVALGFTLLILRGERR